MKDSKDEGGFEYSGSRKAESSWSTSSTMVGCSTIEVFLLNSWPCCCLLPVQGRVQDDILKVLSCSQVMSNLSFFVESSIVRRLSTLKAPAVLTTFICSIAHVQFFGVASSFQQKNTIFPRMWQMMIFFCSFLHVARDSCDTPG